MPLLADRVRETTTTTGQGTLTLDGAPSGFRTFTGAFGNGASVYYVIAGPSEWEIGFGTTGAGTLTRDTVLVSSAGGTTKVTFSAGTKDVFCSYVADRAVTTSDAATLTNKTIDDYTNNVGANSTHFRIKASGTLAKGAVVKAVGFTPGEQAIEVAATSSASDVALGISEQALTTGQFGMAVVIGELFDVNTNGLAVGATLYSNNAGSYTTTKPSSGLYQSLGWVVRANLNNGVIAVNVVAPLYVETSTNTANTAVLRDGSGNFAANAGLFGNGTVGAPALAASADTNTGIYFPAADTLGFVEGGVESMRLDSNGNLLVGTATNAQGWRVRISQNGSAIGLGDIATTGARLFLERGPGSTNVIESGSSAGALAFAVNGTNYWQINSSGHFLAATDTSFDIGASGANRPRDLFLGRNATVAGNLTVDTNTLFVDATNNCVGVGTTSPSAYGTFTVFSAGVGLHANSTSGAAGLTFYENGTGRFSLRTLNGSAGLSFFDSFNGAERARLDASGNLGLGVTPSAWESTCRMLQLGAVATVGRANSGQTQLGFNYFINSAGQYTYIQSLTALRYEQVGGEHRWFNAPSGTAGNAITFTQAMTLDASGRLMVGTTSASGLVTVSQNQNAATTIAVLNADTGSSASSRLVLDTFGGGGYIEVRRIGGAMTFNVNAADRWQISQTGHLLAGADATYDIGASGATRPRDVFIARDLNVDGGTLYVDATNNRVGIRNTSPQVPLDIDTGTGFTTGSTEMLRINRNRVGGFGSTGFVQYYTNASDFGLQITDGTNPRLTLNHALGRFGVGTATPDSALQVGAAGTVGTVRVGNQAVDIQGNPSGGWVCGFQFRGGGGTLRGGLFTNGTADDLNFYTIGSASGVGLIVRHDTANVGIGTTSPAAPLHVATTGTTMIPVLESTEAMGWRFLRAGVGNQLFGRDSNSRFAWVDGADFGGTYLMALTIASNLGLGTTSFGTSAAKVFAIGNGTEPSTGPADTVQFYSVDRSAGNTIPGFRCEGNGVTDAGITNTTVTHKIAMKINGTVYYLLATTNAT